MLKRRPGESPMQQARAEANASVPRENRYNQILQVLGDKQMTSREIAYEMYRRHMIPTSDVNFVRPRLTEMMDDGRIEPCGKGKDKDTGRTVTVFERRLEA